MTSARVQGAVAVYPLLAMTWAFAYAVIATLDVNAFQETVTVNPTEVDNHRYTYFSFVTLTTLGLTDILPMSPLARLLATSNRSSASSSRSSSSPAWCSALSPTTASATSSASRPRSRLGRR